MTPDWKAEFMPWILERGKKYFEEGRVPCLKQEGNTITATVEGSEKYHVEIDLPGGFPDYMECDCPYAQNENNCKHMAAVLFAVDAGEFTFTDDVPNPNVPPVVERVPLKEHWLEAIDTLPETILRSELMRLAQQDHALRHRLTVMHLHGLPEGQLNNWKADLQELAQSYMDRRGKINFADTWEFLMDLDNFLEAKMVGLWKVGAVMDAFYLAWIVLETALETQLDDVDDELCELVDSCEVIWKKAFELATEDQRTQMHRWFWEHRNPSWPNGTRELDRIFLFLPWRDDLYQFNVLHYNKETAEQ